MVELKAGIDWAGAQPSMPKPEKPNIKTDKADRKPAPFKGSARFIGNFGDWDKSVIDAQKRARAIAAHAQTDAVYEDPKFGTRMYPGYGR